MELTESKSVRLQKLLATWGVASRRTIEEWVAAGKIKVDGKVVAEQGLKVDPNRVSIEIDGKPVKAPVFFTPVVMAFHKPFGILSTLEDPFGRPTIKDFLDPGRRVYPVGRLDMDTTGLLLLTDFGELANRLLHPRFKVEKEYEVKIRGLPLAKDELENFARGVTLDDGLTAACQIREIDNHRYRIILKEGRKRQVRRMFSTFQRQVALLKRIRFGPISLGDLQPGTLRPLTEREMKEILALTGL